MRKFHKKPWPELEANLHLYEANSKSKIFFDVLHR